MPQNTNRQPLEPADRTSGPTNVGVAQFVADRDFLARLVGQILATEWLSRQKAGITGEDPPPAVVRGRKMTADGRAPGEKRKFDAQANKAYNEL